MKFLVSSVVIMLLSFAACLYMPWWSIAIAAFLVGVLVYQKPWLAFLSGFVALFILWTVLAYNISNNNDHLLAHKISLLILGRHSPFGLVLLTGTIGALVAGFAAIAGSYLRKAIKSMSPMVRGKDVSNSGELQQVDSTAT